MTEEGEPTVLLIGGTGQNGATLLSRLLAGITGFVAIGELGFLWDRALQGNLPCGCGAPFYECPFWDAVGRSAFGGWDQVDAEEAVRLRTNLMSRRRHRHLSLPLAFPLLAWPSLSRPYRRDLVRYAQLVQRIYEGVRVVSGARVIVDSTKVPGHGFMLWNAGNVDLRVAHLVRDSRGVAFSNVKSVPSQSTIEGRTYRRRHAPARTAARWIWINLAYDALAVRGAPVATVRYEDLVRDPGSELTRIAAFAGAPTSPEALGFLREAEAELPVAHLVAGNRLRFASGTIRILADEEWRTHLPPSQQRVVLAMTWPLVLRYRRRAAPKRSISAGARRANL